MATEATPEEIGDAILKIFVRNGRKPGVRMQYTALASSLESDGEFKMDVLGTGLNYLIENGYVKKLDTYTYMITATGFAKA
jgi:hypothetical protein